MIPHMTYDAEANACYVRLDGNEPGVVIGGCHTEAVHPRVALDFDGLGALIGVEILL